MLVGILIKPPTAKTRDCNYSTHNCLLWTRNSIKNKLRITESTKQVNFAIAQKFIQDFLVEQKT